MFSHPSAKGKSIFGTPQELVKSGSKMISVPKWLLGRASDKGRLSGGFTVLSSWKPHCTAGYTDPVPVTPGGPHSHSPSERQPSQLHSAAEGRSWVQQICHLLLCPISQACAGENGSLLPSSLGKVEKRDCFVVQQR